MVLGLEQVGEFSAEGGLSRALETRHEDYRGAAVEVDGHCRSTHELCELIVYDLYHQLARLYGCEHVHSEGFLFHCIGEELRSV